MRDQDGARRADPDPRTTREWVDIMVPGDWLEFRRHTGHSLRLVRNSDGCIARWRTAEGEDAHVRHGLALDDAYEAARAYLDPRSAPLPSPGRNRWRALGAWLQRSRLVIRTL